jgi:hypothetical protein
LPDEGVEVLVYTPEAGPPHVGIDIWRMHREAPVSFSSITVETGYAWCDHEFEEVTHWMPLPEPPRSALPETPK